MGDKHDSKGQTSGPVNQHKRLAEGQKVTGMKSGGMCKKEGGMAKKPKKKK